MADFHFVDQIPINIINGKVNNLNEQNRLKYLHDHDSSSCTFQSEGVGPTVSRNPLSDVYFSVENMNALQEGLRNMILNQSNGKHNIPRQNETELKIIMRSMYFQFARHYTHIPILDQVKHLNKLVLDYSVKDILSHIQLKEKYLQDISRFPDPLDLPQLSTQKGTKQLEFTGWM
tara:strand:+ start:40705 stop:41229 length:525 start_codon:yes stop_codon:yes gene_type:complete